MVALGASGGAPAAAAAQAAPGSRRASQPPPGGLDSGAQDFAAASFVASGGGGGGGRGGGASPAPAPAPAAPFSVSGMPGAERLSAPERALCEHLQLSPLQYQQIKAVVVNISLVRGIVRRSDVEAKLVHVSVAKIAGVYDLVVQAGFAKGER